MWSSNVPSRFLDELPEAHVEVKEAAGGTGGFGMSGYGPSRFDEMGSFGSSYSTPGWQRAQARKGKGGFSENGQPRYTPDGVFDQREEFDEDGTAGSGHLSLWERSDREAGRVRGYGATESGAPSPRPSPNRGEG